MSDPVNGVTGPAGERPVSPVEAALDARDRRIERSRREEREAEAAAVTTAKPAAPAEPVRPYRVTLDPGTRHLYTEVLDRRTGEVVLRIPPRYVDPETLLDPDEADGDARGGRDIEA